MNGRQIAGVVTLLGVMATLGGCMTAQDHAAAVQNTSDQRLTVGTVQREIRVGMSGADVAAVMGSPNIVTTDDQRRETWVYDKISTERAYSTSSGGVSALVLAGGIVGGALVGGAPGASYTQSSGASSASRLLKNSALVRRHCP